MPVENPLPPIEIRPYSDADGPFLTRVAHRLQPGPTVSPRDPAVLARFFAGAAKSSLLTEPGAEAFVALIAGEPAGLIAVHPDTDFFTGHPRRLR